MTASPRGEQNSRREILNLSKGSSFLSGYFMHASVTRRAGALNASPTRHDAQTVIKKYVYNPGRVTFAIFCARVRRRRL